MDKRFLAAGLALGALPAVAQAQQGDREPTAGAATCYVEVAKLMDDPPSGIGELGAAIRELDTRLRPQVEAVNTLKAQIARLERQAQVAREAGDATFVEADASGPALAPASDPVTEEVRRLQAELQAQHDKLKAEYAEQQRAVVGPVQARVSARAQAFAAQRGCAELKMARTPDLAALASGGSQNVTGDFVTWYLANPG